MAQSYIGQKRLRKYYGKIREVLEMPNLIEVQKSSYDLFLKSGDAPQPTAGDRGRGLQSVAEVLNAMGKQQNEPSDEQWEPNQWVLPCHCVTFESSGEQEKQISPADWLSDQVAAENIQVPIRNSGSYFSLDP